MAFRMVFKGVLFYAVAIWVVDLLLDLSSESSDAYLICLLLFSFRFVTLYGSICVSLCLGDLLCSWYYNMY